LGLKNERFLILFEMSLLNHYFEIEKIQSNDMTTVINLLSGPGSGKSTLAAELFVYLKKQNRNVEYLQEYAKKLVWTKKFDILNNQHIVSWKYYESIKAIYCVKEIEYIILDSSLLNGLWYNRNNLDNLSNIEKTEKLILQYYNEFNNVNIFINRGKHNYNPHGRIQTESQAIAIDSGLKDILRHHSISYSEVNIDSGDPVKDIMDILKIYPSTPHASDIEAGPRALLDDSLVRVAKFVVTENSVICEDES
jgi:hypothetical protein